MKVGYVTDYLGKTAARGPGARERRRPVHPGRAVDDQGRDDRQHRRPVALNPGAAGAPYTLTHASAICASPPRLLWKDRGFAATAVLTLAVCIGANAAIFAVVNSVLLQPLPVPHAEQLVHMYNAYPGAGLAEGRGSTGVPDYYDRLRETDVFQEQALYNTRGVTLSGNGEPQRIRAMMAHAVAAAPAAGPADPRPPLHGGRGRDRQDAQGRS